MEEFTDKNMFWIGNATKNSFRKKKRLEIIITIAQRIQENKGTA